MGGFKVVVTDGVDRNLLEVLEFLSGFVSLPLAFFLSLVFFFLSSFFFHFISLLFFFTPLILAGLEHMFLAQKPTLTL